MNIYAERVQAVTQKRVSISCVVPVHNEEKVIGQFLTALNAELSTLSHDYEIIIVDDGSHDHSLTVIAEHSTPQTKVISFSRNFGKEIALTAGIDHATKDVTILIDCDFQHPLAMLKIFLAEWAKGNDMVYAVRKNRDDESKVKKFFAKCFYRLIGIINEVDIPPHAGDFRLMDSKVVAALNQFKERNRFMKGLYAWVGYQTVAVPYEVQERQAGSSKWSFAKLFKLALNGIFSFSDVPLRVWSVLGLIISLTSFIYGIFIVFDTLVFGADTPGYATIVVAIMFFGGIQLLSIGILGEYIGRIFTEVKRRPTYLVKTKIGFDK